MLLEKDNILEFNQYMKSDKMPYNIYAEIESLVKKVDGCANGKDCMKKLCTSLREHGTTLINFEKKKIYH